MVGRFIGENKLLVFTPDKAEMWLMWGSILFGAAASIVALLGGPAPLGAWWVGPAVLLAGLWALVSYDHLFCVLKEKTYVRHEGGGLRVTRGRLAEMDALVVIVTDSPRGGFESVHTAAFRILLHWKGGVHPPMIVGSVKRSYLSPDQLPQLAVPLVAQASIYGKALGIPVYNNTGFFSPSPLPPI